MPNRPGKGEPQQRPENTFFVFLKIPRYLSDYPYDIDTLAFNGFAE